MKTSNFKPFFIYIFSHLFGSFCFANPPLKMDQVERIGRLTLFKSNYEYNYYLPSAFRSELECLPQGKSKHRCLLRIINELNISEFNSLNDSDPSAAISDLSYDIVESINENLTLNSEFSNKTVEKTMYTKTLRLSNAPYVLTSFIIDNSKIEYLQNSYKNSKIGNFKVQVLLNAAETNYYLGIKDSIEFKKRLLALEGVKIKSSEITNTIKNITNGLEIESKGDPDPSVRISEIIRLKYFHKFNSLRYQVKLSEANKLNSNQTILLDDSTFNNPYLCEINFEISEKSLPITQCERMENN